MTQVRFPSIKRLSQICDGKLLGPGGAQLFHGVQIDSRRVAPGDLFFALPGANVDGHEFAEAAGAAGATAVVVRKGTLTSLHKDRTYVVVEDVLQALQRLAGWYRATHIRQVIAITGSNGKTMVKDALMAMLATRASVACSPGSYNSQIGVPLSLLSMPPGTELGIVEVGVSEPGDMAPLAQIVRPDFGILTNIGLAHVGSFGSKVATAREKRLLFEGIDATGWLLVPGADPLVDRWSHELAAKVVQWEGDDSDLPSMTVMPGNASPSQVQLEFPSGEVRPVHLPSISVPWSCNLQIAASAAWLLGVDEDKVCSAMENMEFQTTRTESWQTQAGITIINDAYTSDPISVQAALASEKEARSVRGRRIFVFGGMKGLGDRSWAEHALIGRLAAESGISHLVVLNTPDLAATAQSFLQTNKSGDCTTIASLQELEPAVLRSVEAGDRVLFKGPRGQGLSLAAARLRESMAPKRLMVDLGAIEENIACFRRLLGPHTQILAMLKAWGYGTELARMATTLQRGGVDWIGVSTVGEGVLARRAGVHLPILVTLADRAEIADLLSYRLTPAIYSQVLAEALIEQAQAREGTLQVHLKVDTGMGRLGVRPQQLRTLIDTIRASDALQITGILTHLSSADEPDSDAATQQQLQRFQEAIAIAESAGCTNLIKHAAATSAAIRFPSSRLDLVRLGLGMFGIHPSPATAQAIQAEGLDLQVAVALVSRIAHVASFEKGAKIGYGGSYTVPNDKTRIGVVEVGYNDGVPWRLSNKGQALIHGKLVPFVGRVSMDSLSVDLSAVPEAKPGDDVLLYGSYQGELLRPEHVAKLAGTIPYELLVRIDTRRVQRVFIEG